MYALPQILSRDLTTSRVARLLLILGCVAVLVAELYGQAHPHSVIWYDDFYTYYTAALALRHGSNPLAPAALWIHSAHASASQGAPIGGPYYVYPPIFALVLMPLTLLPLYPAFLVWDVSSLILLVAAVYACMRVAGLRPTPLHLMLVATAIALLRMVRFGYVVGQADMFLMFLVCAAFWAYTSRRPTIAAILLGFACATKPVLLPLVVFLLWKREFRFALTTIAAFVVLLLAPFVVLGGQALRDQLDIWRYWSNEYAPYTNAFAPKNVLARLFSPNPYVQPIVNAPVLTTILWLLTVAVVVVLTAAVVSPRRLATDAHTLLEIGVVVTALLLINPLTEINHMIQLAIPLLGCYCCLRKADWRTPGVRLVAVGTVLVWLLLCTASKVPFSLLGGTSLVGRLYYSLVTEAYYLYIMIAFFALQLRLLHTLSGVSTSSAVQQLVRTAPALAKQWVADVGVTFRRQKPGLIPQPQKTQAGRVN